MMRALFLLYKIYERIVHYCQYARGVADRHVMLPVDLQIFYIKDVKQS